MTIKLADGRSELWQWDTGRKITFDDANIKQAHFQNHANGYGRTIDVDVEDGAAKIPDELLQAALPLTVYAYVGEESNGYTKVERFFAVKPRKRPAEYVFTPADQLTLRKLESMIGNLDDLTTTAKNNLVAAINEAAKTGSGGAGSIDLRTADGYIQYSNDGGATWENLIALADLKGEKGEKGDTGATGPQGAPGKDYTLTAADKTEIAAEAAAAVAETSVPAPASAAVGQIVKVKAVDAAGKITQTEAVDLPTGGGSSDTWELITSGEMAEAAALLITTDADGAALALKSAQIIVEGATSFERSTMLRFEVDSSTDSRNREEWAVEYLGDSKNDNPDIHAVYIAEQNKVPILNAESPTDAVAWATKACKVQFAKKNTNVNGANTYSFDPLTKTIKRIYVGNYMGNGKLGAGCKYQIWGIRA